jgi:hypothetical protein
LVLVRGDGAEDAGGEGLGEGRRSRVDGFGGRELGELEQAPWDLVGVGAEEFGEVGTDLRDGVGEGEGGDDTAAVVAVEAVQAVPGGGCGGGQEESAGAAAAGAQAGGGQRVHRGEGLRGGGDGAS